MSTRRPRASSSSNLGRSPAPSLSRPARTGISKFGTSIISPSRRWRTCCASNMRRSAPGLAPRPQQQPTSDPITLTSRREQPGRPRRTPAAPSRPASPARPAPARPAPRRSTRQAPTSPAPLVPHRPVVRLPMPGSLARRTTYSPASTGDGRQVVPQSGSSASNRRGAF